MQGKLEFCQLMQYYATHTLKKDTVEVILWMVQATPSLQELTRQAHLILEDDSLATNAHKIFTTCLTQCSAQFAEPRTLKSILINLRASYRYRSMVIVAEGANSTTSDVYQRCAVWFCARLPLLCHKVAPSIPGSFAPQFKWGAGLSGLLMPPASGHMCLRGVISV